MGSGATAQRMAFGATLAQKESYLAELLAKKQDVSSVFQKQESGIDRLMQSVQTNVGDTSPTIVEQISDPAIKANVTPLIIIGFIIYYLWNQ